MVKNATVLPLRRPDTKVQEGRCALAKPLPINLIGFWVAAADGDVQVGQRPCTCAPAGELGKAHAWHCYTSTHGRWKSSSTSATSTTVDAMAASLTILCSYHSGHAV